MAEHNSYFVGQLCCCLFERDRVMGLFNGINGVTLCLQVLDSVQSLFVIRPFDGFFGAECGLVNLLIRWAATDTAEHHAFYAHGVGGAEDRTHVMLTAHVIEYHDQRQFVRLAVLVHVHATHLGCGQFFTHSANGKWTRRILASSSISVMKSSCNGIMRPSSSSAKIFIVLSSTRTILPMV